MWTPSRLQPPKKHKLFPQQTWGAHPLAESPLQRVLKDPTTRPRDGEAVGTGDNAFFRLLRGIVANDPP